MRIPDAEALRRLGDGESIESVARAAGLTMKQFDLWWKRQAELRTPDLAGTVDAPVQADVEIVRDGHGIPHIFASNDRDLFFGYGYAMAQDRLWQLDYYRRRGMGRLSEVLGSDALEYDRIVRTVGINRIAARQTAALPEATRHLLEAFSSGINAAMEASSDRLPIEFDLLDYRPEPWSPVDTVAILAEFRWYLTGRMPVIFLPELAKRYLADPGLYSAFLTPEAGDESIVPPGSYPSAGPGSEPVGEVVGDPYDWQGSNNWVVSGILSKSGAPMVASDPHIAFGSVSCWYEARLSGGSFDTAGAGYCGVPGFWFGRNQRMAWGLTNNICSQRDLYQEMTSPEHTDAFLYGYDWEPARSLTERIEVKGCDPVEETVRFSHNGPLVDHFLPEPARATGPVSIKWLGATFSDEISCLLDMGRADDCDGFREALRPWRVPTLSFGFADVDGRIGYQAGGRIPIRSNWDRGYRPGWEPEHQWRGLVPYDHMPRVVDPPEGWVRSANNRTAPDDFPYPLSGQWGSGYRAKRVREMIEAGGRSDREDFARMQSDVQSERAVEAVPSLLSLLAGSLDERVKDALEALASWDRRVDAGSAAGAVFEIFFPRWCSAVATQRFPEEAAPLLAGALSGLAVALLAEDEHGWFGSGGRAEAAEEALRATLDELEERMGPDPSQWSWGELHRVNLPHLLDGRGDLGKLLSRGGQPCGGSGVTVCNTGFDPNYLAGMGANFRLVVDLGETPPALWTVDAAGQSGHPGSPNYCDQITTWLEGGHHRVPMDRAEAEGEAAARLVLRSG